MRGNFSCSLQSDFERIFTIAICSVILHFDFLFLMDVNELIRNE